MSIKYNRLPDRLFQVRVPRMATYTDLELEVIGTPVMEFSNGAIGEVDNEMITVHLPLTKIIDIYSMGMRIMLTNPNETTDIYNILEEYLANTTPFNNTFNMPTYEENRDLDIDKFASEMFNINRANIVDNTINKKSAFDIGLEQLVIKPISSNVNLKTRGSVTDSYMSQNPLATGGGMQAVLSDGRETIDPTTVTRKSRVRRRKIVAARS